MRTWKLIAVVLSAVLAAIISFRCVYLFDNKYRWPGPVGKEGVTDFSDFKEQSLSFLVYGWEVYEDRLLTPEEIHEQELSPDRYVYAGQYGGFEFGDRMKVPEGSATYRMRILLGPGEQQYCLGLPEIYSAYRLWIDGKLLKTMGDPAPETYKPWTQITSLEFWASGETEIVLQISNFTSFYSGLLYPPAFGEPDAVVKMQQIYLILHTAVVFGALFLGIICIISSVQGIEVREQSRLFFLLCIFYAAYVGYPLIHTLGFQGMGWYLLEKLGLYGMLMVLVLLAGTMAEWPLEVRAVIFAAGNMVCALVFLFPFLPMRWDVDVMRLYSQILHWWQLAVAFVLFLVSVFIMRKGNREAAVLGWGMVYFGTSLTVNGLLYPFEPVYTGWPPETGGFLLIALIGGILVLRSRQNYGQRIRMEKLQELARQELDAQKKYSEMLTDYLDRTGKRNHEYKKNLELMMYYLEKRDYGKLTEYVSGLQKKEEGIGVPFYTVNPLINSIMATRCSRADREGIACHLNLLNLPKSLTIEDGELCSLLTNLLDNAIEGAGRLPGRRERWIKTGMELKGNCFSVLVENSAMEPPADWQERGRKRTQKSDSMSHGYGMKIIADIVEAYNGIEEIRWENGVYIHHVVLFLRPEED